MSYESENGDGTFTNIKVEEVIARVAEDPYMENVVHSGLHPSSISHIINGLFWSDKRSYNKVTLEVSKEIDDHHISVKIVSREKSEQKKI